MCHHSVTGVCKYIMSVRLIDDQLSYRFVELLIERYIIRFKTDAIGVSNCNQIIINNSIV